LPAVNAAGINDLIELTHQMPRCPSVIPVEGGALWFCRRAEIN
jgi:hypothetical protein